MTRYFAYGSNMNLQRLIERGIHPRGGRPATLESYRLVFNKVADADPRRGYASIETREGARVEGVLYDLDKEDLRTLDEYDGAQAGRYHRIEVTVYLNDGAGAKAVTYQADPSKVKSGLKPSREYLSHLLAAREFVSRAYLQWLEGIETLD